MLVGLERWLISVYGADATGGVINIITRKGADENQGTIDLSTGSLADGLCRIIIPKTELPIGILISLIGAPCFVYLMIKKTYGFGGN